MCLDALSVAVRLLGLLALRRQALAVLPGPLPRLV